LKKVLRILLKTLKKFWLDIMQRKFLVNGPSGNVQHVWCFPQDELPSQRKCERQLQ
jgi:hypothetical protein